MSAHSKTEAAQEQPGVDTVKALAPVFRRMAGEWDLFGVYAIARKLKDYPPHLRSWLWGESYAGGLEPSALRECVSRVAGLALSEELHRNPDKLANCLAEATNDAKGFPLADTCAPPPHHRAQPTHKSGRTLARPYWFKVCQPLGYEAFAEWDGGEYRDYFLKPSYWTGGQGVCFDHPNEDEESAGYHYAHPLRPLPNHPVRVVLSQPEQPKLPEQPERRPLQLEPIEVPFAVLESLSLELPCCLVCA
jgi:hypothetical protein